MLDWYTAILASLNSKLYDALGDAVARLGITGLSPPPPQAAHIASLLARLQAL